jgi:transposase
MAKDPAWANRRRLLRDRERLSDRSFTRMWEQITAHEPAGQLLAAWIANEEPRFLLALAYQGATRSQISNRLFAFYDWCVRADVPEVTTLAQTIEARWPQILAFIDTGITNAATEGVNRLVGGQQERPVRRVCARRCLANRPGPAAAADPRQPGHGHAAPSLPGP